MFENAFVCLNRESCRTVYMVNNAPHIYTGHLSGFPGSDEM